MHKLKIRFLVKILHVLVIVTIEAKNLDPDNGIFDSIEELILEGDQDHFTATAIMKSRKEIDLDNIKRTELNNDGTGNDEEKYDNEEIDESKESDESEETDKSEEQDENKKKYKSKQKSTLLRKNPWKSWQKSAAKQCKKACTAAYKDVCSFHECRKRFKKDLKKQCKISCQDFFME